MDWINTLQNIQNKIKFQLHAKNIDNLERVFALLAEFDQDKSGYLDKTEFNKMLAKIGAFLTSQELRSVFNAFDTNQDGHINYGEFIQMIRTSLSDKRRQLVEHGFKFLDKEGRGVLPLRYLIQQYRAQEHPRVRTREKTLEQIKNEFEVAISKRSYDGENISFEDFYEYYLDVNATLPDQCEQYFIDLVIKTWGITTGPTYVSQERLAQLEAILFEKIRQKTKSGEDEGRAVKRQFKFFDINDTGVISYKDFQGALERFGCTFQPHEVDALFNKYDTDSSGKLAYDEFCAMFALMGASTNPNVNPVFELNRRQPNEVLQRLRDLLKSRGTYAIAGLGRHFKRVDKSNNKKLDREEFTWALKEYGLELTKNEFDKLFKYFDKNCDGEVNYDEFLVCVRGELNQQRLNVIHQAYNKLDNTADGRVTLEDIKNVYDASKHKDVISGKRNADQILLEYLNNFDLNNKDGTVTREEFEDYYRNVSASIDSDAYFINMVERAWKLGQYA